MRRRRGRTLLAAARWLLCACCLPVACSSREDAGPTLAPAPTTAPTHAAPTADPFFRSEGGGEPRSPGYWMLWNTCAPGNRAETAIANGGRAAGWFLMDDLLADPGVLVGSLPVETCAQGLYLLQGLRLDGADPGQDAAYPLASRLLAAQLNLAAGAAYCAAVRDAVQAGQMLLVSVSFDGTGAYIGPMDASGDWQLAQTLTDALAKYNTGQLCIP